MDRRPIFSLACALAAMLAAGCDRVTERDTPPPAIESRSQANAAPAVSPEIVSGTEPMPPQLAPRASISDAMITARIKADLRADPELAGADVSVNTSHGAVVLNGTVKSYEQAGIASSHAQRQDGVMGVDNQLSLLPR